MPEGVSAIGHENILAEGYAGDFGFASSVHNIAVHYILSYGTQEQKRRWLPRLATGELIGAIAMSEPGTGSDLQRVRTWADAHGNEYRVNGSKTFISNGRIANFFLLVAKTDTTQGSKGVSLFGMETEGLEGFRRGRNLDKLGLKAQDTSELFFDDVRLSGDDLLGIEPGQGFYQLMRQLPWERLVIALQAVSMSRLALDLTLEYVKERKLFGQRVMDFQDAAFVRFVNERQRGAEDRKLLRRVVGRSEIVSHWGVHEQAARPMHPPDRRLGGAALPGGEGVLGGDSAISGRGRGSGGVGSTRRSRSAASSLGRSMRGSAVVSASAPRVLLPCRGGSRPAR